MDPIKPGGKSPSSAPTAPPDASSPGKGAAAQSKNEGEGNRTADREYREGAKAFVRSGQVDARAKEAAAAIDGPEGAKLQQAEDAARKGPKR